MGIRVLDMNERKHLYDSADQTELGNLQVIPSEEMGDVDLDEVYDLDER